MITYQREVYNPCHDGFRELNEAHGIELRGTPAELNVAQYMVLQREGRLILITAKDDTNYIGYSSHFWNRDLHFNWRVAQDDAWYVKPEYRNQGVGRRLREEALKELKKDNVKYVYGRLKIAHPHDSSMEGLGYIPFETVWIKDLTK